MIELENLDKDEKILMMEFLPVTEVIEFLEKNRKLFGNEFNGTYFKPKSKLLRKKIPNAFLKSIERGDSITSNFIKKVIGKKLEEINKYIKLKLDSTQDIKEIIKTKQRDRYLKLVDILLEKIEPQYILLFLKLNGIELKVRQKKLIETRIEEVIVYRKIREQVKKIEKEKLKVKYKEEIKLIKDKDEILLKNEKDKNQILNYQVLEKDKTIREIKQKFNEKIGDIDKQQKKNNDFKKKLETVESENQRINKQLYDNKKVWQQELEKERQRNEELKIINEKQNLKIKQLDNDLKERYETYSKKYVARWEEEHQTILNEKRVLIEQINSLKDNIKVLQNEIMDLEKKKETTQEKLSEYNSLVTNFISNIDKELITSALKSSILNVKGLTQTKENHMEIYIKNQIKSHEIEVCESIDEWSKVISHNLKNIGVRKNRNEWSDYIVSVLAAKMIPLIVGCKTREIAKAISCTYAGETPFIITLPGGYSDVNQLIELYHNCEAKVILIEGVVGQMNESLMLPLFKEYIEAEKNNRLILISCEDVNMFNLMPSYLFEYVAPIKITDIIPVVNHNYIYINSTSVLQLLRKNQLEINDSYKKLNKLLKHIEVINAYIITRALILAYLCKNREMQNALVCLSICDLKLMFTDDDIREKIANNIDNYQNDFTQDLKNLIVGE